MSGEFRAIEDFGMRTPQIDIDAACALVRCVKEKFGYCRVIEVGSWTGRMALAMVEVGADRVDCIDTWAGTDDPADQTFEAEAKHGKDAIWRAFQSNCNGWLGTKIHGFRGKSLDIAATWPAEAIAELLFIDADHRYESVLADIKAWERFVRVGGIVAGHDYEEGWPGVVRAVNETGGCEKGGNSMWWRWKE